MSHNSISHVTLPATDFGPFPIDPDWIIEGTPIARGNVFLQSEDQKVSYGGWECTAGKFHWVFGWDEFVQILEGEATIQEESGKTVTLRRGDLAHFPKGMKSVWTVPNYVRKVFTLRTDEPLVM